MRVYTSSSGPPLEQNSGGTIRCVGVPEGKVAGGSWEAAAQVPNAQRRTARTGVILLWVFLCFAAAYALLLLVEGAGLTAVAR